MQKVSPKILITDDDPLLARMYQKKFEEDGFQVETAENGFIALDKVNEFHPDVILLDIMMPYLDGVSFLKKMKKYKNLEKIPVVILTNLEATIDEIREARKYGASAFLLKGHTHPIDVVKKIKEFL